MCNNYFLCYYFFTHKLFCGFLCIVLISLYLWITLGSDDACCHSLKKRKTLMYSTLTLRAAWGENTKQCLFCSSHTLPWEASIRCESANQWLCIMWCQVFCQIKIFPDINGEGLDLLRTSVKPQKEKKKRTILSHTVTYYFVCWSWINSQEPQQIQNIVVIASQSKDIPHVLCRFRGFVVLNNYLERHKTYWASCRNFEDTW